MAVVNGKNAGSKLPVLGYEEMVDDLRSKEQVIKSLTKEASVAKGTLRKVALDAAAAGLREGRSIKTVEFQGRGGKVVVSLPDYTKESSRTQIKPEQLLEAEQAGLSLGGLWEESRWYVLRESWVEWFGEVLASWKAAGRVIPEGLEEHVTLKLTADGVSTLRIASQNPGESGEMARKLLDGGCRAPTLSVK